MMKTSVVLLSVAVIVLGLVAFAPRPPQPTVIAGQVYDDGSQVFIAFRFWSDGTVDWSRMALLQGPDDCEPVSLCGPPMVVIP